MARKTRGTKKTGNKIVRQKNARSRNKNARKSPVAEIINALPKIFLMFLIGLMVSTHAPVTFPSTGFAASGASLLILPYEQSIAVGSKLVVIVEVNDVRDLYAYQTDIVYNPSLLSLERVQQGSFLSHEFADQTLYNIPDVSVPGIIKNIVESRTGDAGVRGSGTLVKLTFKVLAPGQSEILFTNDRFLDSNGEAIPLTVLESTINGLEPSKTCQQLQGIPCTSGEACAGSLLDAGDVPYCCDRQCVEAEQSNNRPQPQFSIYKLTLGDETIYREHEQRTLAVEKNIPFDLGVTVQNEGSIPANVRSILELPSAARLLSLDPHSAIVQPGGFQTFHALVEPSGAFAGRAVVVSGAVTKFAPFQVLMENERQQIIQQLNSQLNTPAQPELPAQQRSPSWPLLLLFIALAVLLVGAGGYAWQWNLLNLSPVQHVFSLFDFNTTYIVDAPYLGQLVRFKLADRYNEVCVVLPYDEKYATSFNRIVTFKLSKTDEKKAKQLAKRFGIPPHLAKAVAVSLTKSRPKILTSERIPPRLSEEYGLVKFADVIHD